MVLTDSIGDSTTTSTSSSTTNTTTLKANGCRRLSNSDLVTPPRKKARVEIKQAQEATQVVADEVYTKHLSSESKYYADPTIWNGIQTDINYRMRGILIDWLGEVVTEYKLHPQTLFLTVNYIDRFLCHEVIHRSNLQLVGVSCLLIASKLEETHPLAIEELLYICDNSYERKQVLDLEIIVLTRLKFMLSCQTSLSFLLRLISHLDLSNTVVTRAQVSKSPSLSLSVLSVRHVTLAYPLSPISLSQYCYYITSDKRHIYNIIVLVSGRDFPAAWRMFISLSLPDCCRCSLLFHAHRNPSRMGKQNYKHISVYIFVSHIYESFSIMLLSYVSFYYVVIYSACGLDNLELIYLQGRFILSQRLTDCLSRSCQSNSSSYNSQI